MAYLTFDEYKELLPSDMDQETFEKLEKRAEMALDDVTRYFYQGHDLNADSTPRKLAFKRAIALTIEQMDKTGMTSAVDGLALTSLSIGQTSISLDKNSVKLLSLVPIEANSLLSSVGLLYKGVRYV